MHDNEVVYLTVLVPYTIDKSILNPSREDTDIKLSNLRERGARNINMWTNGFIYPLTFLVKFASKLSFSE